MHINCDLSTVFAMKEQDSIKRTLITTALAFFLSILSWYIQSLSVSEDKTSVKKENINNKALESMIITEFNH